WKFKSERSGHAARYARRGCVCAVSDTPAWQNQRTAQDLTPDTRDAEAVNQALRALASVIRAHTQHNEAA
ncbi:MAG: hypothetical protein ACR2M1_03500, partial [Gemmatimonadaceae bacterium]